MEKYGLSNRGLLVVSAGVLSGVYVVVDSRAGKDGERVGGKESSS